MWGEKGGIEVNKKNKGGPVSRLKKKTKDRLQL
jgi:hypothetical protein